MSYTIGRLCLRALEVVIGADSDGTRSDYAGSLLDWSVNYGHGLDGGRREAVREMSQLQERAEQLDEQAHYRL